MSGEVGQTPALRRGVAVRVAGTLESLATIVARHAVEALAFRLKDEWVSAAHLAISGGTVTSAVIEVLAEGIGTHGVDWSKVHVWWTDERYVPDGHIGRHETKARVAGLARIGIPESNIHAVDGPTGDEEHPDRSAENYQALLKRYAPHGRVVPMFDLVLLEVGPSGTVAALRPQELGAEAPGVVPLWDAETPCPLQVTMTLPAIREGVRVWCLASGADRAVTVGRSVLTGTGDTAAPPIAARAQGGLETIWWLDASASRAVPFEARTAAEH